MACLLSMAGHQRTVDTGYPSGRQTGGHPGGRRTGGRYLVHYGWAYNTCFRYGEKEDADMEGPREDIFQWLLLKLAP